MRYIGKKLELLKKVSDLKEASPCLDCHLFYPACCMDYDHLPSKSRKKAAISTMVRKNREWALIESEIAKCELVCSNCHRIRTRDRRRHKVKKKI